MRRIPHSFVVLSVAAAVAWAVAGATAIVFDPAPRGAAAHGPREVIEQKFNRKKLEADWRIKAEAGTRAWRVEKGELRGMGGGHLDYMRPLPERFTLAFDAETQEKANIEVQLVDGDGNVQYIFAFLGTYHPVLEGVKFAILKGNGFVAVDPKHWIFPGRKFRFEVRRAGGRFQMFLDGEMGPTFDDREPVNEDMHLRIIYAAGKKKDWVRFDDIRLELTG